MSSIKQEAKRRYRVTRVADRRRPPRMTRIDIDPHTWSSVRAVCIEHGLEVPQLLGAIVRQAINDVPRLKLLLRKTVQAAR